MSGRPVAIVFGGRSVEHEVSVDSARSVRSALEDAGFDTVALGVTHDGSWVGPDCAAVVLDDSARRRVETPADAAARRVALDPTGRRLVLAEGDRCVETLDVDVIFPLIHGWGGEDGRLQGTLDTCGIPYVGSGVTGSALAMDKIFARSILDAHGVPSVAWRALTSASDSGHASRLADQIGFPMFVKPANGGSSVGVSRVTGPSEFRRALDEAFALDRRVIVERGVDAREIECGVLGNAAPEASIPGEVVPSAAFYDYADKYVHGTAELRIPAPLPDEVAAEVRRLAAVAFGVLDLAGLARVDFLVDRGSGGIFLNEVNTLPGFTSISMYPKLWAASGLETPRLVSRLVELARERFAAEASRRVRLATDGHGAREEREGA